MSTAHGKITVYKIRGRVSLEAGQRGYIVCVNTNRGHRDLAYYHGSDAYDSASATAESINKHGRWTGGRDPLRGIDVIQVVGKVATVYYS